MSVGTVTLESLHDKEIAPGIWLIGEPTPVAGTDKLRCLANVGGALGIVELRIRFADAALRGDSATEKRP